MLTIPMKQELNLMELCKICTQLAPTRCKHVPNFITLALIAPEKWSSNRKLDMKLFSQWSVKYRS